MKGGLKKNFKHLIETLFYLWLTRCNVSNHGHCIY